MPKVLHPQNDRIGTAGIPFPPNPAPRRSPVFVTEHGQEQHEMPLYSAVQGETHYAICREKALYAFGENWCETCRMHRLTIDDSG